MNEKRVTRERIRDCIFHALSGISEKPLASIAESHMLTMYLSDSLEWVEVIVDVEERLNLQDSEDMASKYSYILPEVREIMPRTVADLIDHVYMSINEDESEKLKLLEDKVIKDFYPELMGSGLRLDNRTFLLRKFFQSQFFALYSSSYSIRPGVVLKEFLHSFDSEDETVRYVFSIPVAHDTKGQLFLIICFLTNYIWIVELSRQGNLLRSQRYLRDEVKFYRGTKPHSDFNYFDRVCYVLETIDSKTYFDIPDKYKAIGLKRLGILRQVQELFGRISRRILAKASQVEEVEYSYGSLVPQCTLNAFGEFPRYVVTRDYLSDFLQYVKSENDFMELVLAPIIRSQQYEIDQFVRHGISDTAHEEGKDIFAISRLGLGIEAGELVKAFVVKRGSVRKVGGKAPVARYSEIVRQIETAFATKYYSHILRENVLPQYVVLCITGEIPAATKRQLKEVTERGAQQLQFMDRERILNSYFQHEIPIDLQHKLITYVEQARELCRVL